MVAEISLGLDLPAATRISPPILLKESEEGSPFRSGQVLLAFLTSSKPWTLPGADKQSITLPGADKQSITLPGADKQSITLPGADKRLRSSPVGREFGRLTLTLPSSSFRGIKKGDLTFYKVQDTLFYLNLAQAFRVGNREVGAFLFGGAFG
jgi:hypothetical protein